MSDEIKINTRRLYQPGRFMVLESGYVFDRYIFRSWGLLVVIICVTLFFQVGAFSTFAYAYCPDNGSPCTNPLFDKCDLPACEQEILFPGEEVGEKPPSFFPAYFYLSVLLILAFVVNHFAQNTEKYMEARKNARS